MKVLTTLHFFVILHCTYYLKEKAFTVKYFHRFTQHAESKTFYFGLSYGSEFYTDTLFDTTIKFATIFQEVYFLCG